MPSSCGLGLKSTVGTAVSVPPLGLPVKRQRRSGGGAGGGGERETGEDFYIFMYIRDIFNKI